MVCRVAWPPHTKSNIRLVLSVKCRVYKEGGSEGAAAAGACIRMSANPVVVQQHLLACHGRLWAAKWLLLVCLVVVVSPPAAPHCARTPDVVLRESSSSSVLYPWLCVV